MNPQKIYQQAFQLHQSGKLPEAEKLYRDLLKINSNEPNVLHLLGMVLHRMGKSDQGLPLIERSIKLLPTQPSFHINLGAALLDLGRPGDAEVALLRALALQPSNAGAQYNLGKSRLAKKDFLGAISAFEKSLANKPDFLDALLDLASALGMAGDSARAEAILARAASLNPKREHIWYDLGVLCAQQAKWAAATDAFQRALFINPQLAIGWSNLGRALRARRLFQNAHDAYAKAAQINPDMAQAHAGMAQSLFYLGDHPKALVAARKAAELKPQLIDHHLLLGDILREANDFRAAEACYRKALDVDPSNAKAYNGLGNTFLLRGLAQSAMEYYRKAVEMDPANAHWLNNLLLAMQYQSAVPPEEIFRQARQFDALHAKPLAALTMPRTSIFDANRKLRIGYVSGDFRAHVVAFIIMPILENQDRESFEIFGYSNHQSPDKATERVRSLCDHWREIVDVDDAQAAAQIRADQIDILVDLSGHTAGNRLLIFAHKPAPIQITAIGYPDTTGLSAMDFRLTDAIADPVGQTEAFHSEKLLRMPGSFFIFTPPELPARVVAPVERNGFITFGSCNNLAKIDSEQIDCWCEILNGSANSRLIMKARGLSDASVRARLLDQFASAGIDASRIELIAWLPTRDQHLAVYQQMDIALDSFPYNGTTTTFESLWMGVPVVSRAGRTHVQRVGASLLKAAGLPELVGNSRREYIDIARQLANDRPRLSALRQKLFDQMPHSPLVDAKTYTRNLESLYRQVWREYTAMRAAR